MSPHRLKHMAQSVTFPKSARVIFWGGKRQDSAQPGSNMIEKRQPDVGGPKNQILVPV
jgi:hypothetical protein